jgi:hypothetical protein
MEKLLQLVSKRRYHRLLAVIPAGIKNDPGWDHF